MQAKIKNLNIKKMIIITISVAAFAILCIVGYIMFFAKPASAQVSYREVTPTMGDLIVGIEESGLVALSRSIVSFDSAAEVKEVMVKAGYTVAKGDTLFVLDTQSIEDSIKSIENEYQKAVFTLDQAVANKAVKISDAKQTYEDTLSSKSTAALQKETSALQAENDLLTADLNIENAKEQIAELEALLLTYPDDYAHLSELEQWQKDASQAIKDLQSSQTTYTDQTSEELSYAKNKKTAMESASESLKKAQQDELFAYQTYNMNPIESNLTKLESAQQATIKASYQLSVAQSEYSAFAGNESTINQTIDSIKDQLATAQAESDNFSSAYTEFKKIFDQTYSMTDKEMESKIKTLNQDIEKYTISKAKTEASAKSTAAQSNQQASTAQSSASVAKAKLDATLLEIENSISLQEASVEELKNQISDKQEVIDQGGIIVAPCDGMVVSCAINAGDNITANQTLASIAKTDAVFISVSVSEEDITQVSIDQSAQVTFTAFEDQIFPAKVDSITAEPARAGASSITYTVTVRLDSAKIEGLLDGMSASVTFIKEIAEQAIYISSKSITTKGNKSYVTLKGADGEPSEKEVTTGITDGRNIQIISGVSMDDTILVAATGSTQSIGASFGSSSGSGSSSQSERPSRE